MFSECYILLFIVNYFLFFFLQVLKYVVLGINKLILMFIVVIKTYLKFKTIWIQNKYNWFFNLKINQILNYRSVFLW